MKFALIILTLIFYQNGQAQVLVSNLMQDQIAICDSIIALQYGREFVNTYFLLAETRSYIRVKSENNEANRLKQLDWKEEWDGSIIEEYHISFVFKVPGRNSPEYCNHWTFKLNASNEVLTLPVFNKTSIPKLIELNQLKQIALTAFRKKLGACHLNFDSKPMWLNKHELMEYEKAEATIIFQHRNHSFSKKKSTKTGTWVKKKSYYLLINACTGAIIAKRKFVFEAEYPYY